MSFARCFFGFVLCILPAFLFSIVCFFHHVRKFAELGTEGGAIEACQMDDLLYPERSIDHLDFSPIKGIFCIQYLFVRLHFSLIASVMKSFLKRADTCTEIM